MVHAQKPFVILSLSKDLGNAAEENIKPHFYCSSKILRLRTSCFAQNDIFGQLLTPNSSLLTPHSLLGFPVLPLSTSLLLYSTLVIG